MQESLVNTGAVLRCRLVHADCTHSLLVHTASFAADTLLMTAFQRTKSVRAHSSLAKITIKRVKKQFILMSRRGSAIVLQQPSGYRGYL